MPTLTANEIKLAEQARDAFSAYMIANAKYHLNQGTLDEVMEAKRLKERTNRALRTAIKRGAYAKIERDLKKKYGKHYDKTK